MKQKQEFKVGDSELFRVETDKLLHCHRCGWEGTEKQLDLNEYGEACPKCPQYRDIHASLSEI